MTIVLVFIFGLIIGSFLNAVIFRLHTGESFLLSRSHCMHCKHELAAIDLVPIFSFIFLSGRCRYCGKKISWQYPIVEFLTGIAFVLFAITNHFSLFTFHFFLQLVFAAFLIIIAIFDFKYYLILDKVVFPALGLIVIWNIFHGRLLSGLLAGLVVSGFFAAQYYISGGRWIGFGDVKFGLFLGNLLGLKLSVVMLMLAYFSGAIVGVVLILFKRKTFGSQLPFGVFLSLSAIITMLYGQQLADWYFRLIGL